LKLSKFPTTTGYINSQKFVEIGYDLMTTPSHGSSPNSYSDERYTIVYDGLTKTLFQPIFDELKINPIIREIYVHSTRLHGQFLSVFPPKLKNVDFGIYFVQVPPQSGTIMFAGNSEKLEPMQYKFVIIPKGERIISTPHMHGSQYMITVTLPFYTA